MFMNVLSLQASAYLLWLAGRVLWRKWRKLSTVSPVAELLDRLIVLLGVLDAIYYIPCMLVLMQVSGWITCLGMAFTCLWLARQCQSCYHTANRHHPYHATDPTFHFTTHMPNILSGRVASADSVRARPRPRAPDAHTRALPQEAPGHRATVAPARGALGGRVDIRVATLP